MAPVFNFALFLGILHCAFASLAPVHQAEESFCSVHSAKESLWSTLQLEHDYFTANVTRAVTENHFDVSSTLNGVLSLDGASSVSHACEQAWPAVATLVSMFTLVVVDLAASRLTSE